MQLSEAKAYDGRTNNDSILRRADARSMNTNEERISPLFVLHKGQSSPRRGEVWMSEISIHNNLEVTKNRLDDQIRDIYRQSNTSKKAKKSQWRLGVTTVLPKTLMSKEVLQG